MATAAATLSQRRDLRSFNPVSAGWIFSQIRGIGLVEIKLLPVLPDKIF
jgi:hypothetical protein